jgi:hypothetical protein
VKQDFDARFLAKLALGFGRTVPGPGFVATKYAHELRKGLWQKAPAKPGEIRVRGSRFFQHGVVAKELHGVAWRGGWTLLFSADDNNLTLVSDSDTRRPGIERGCFRRARFLERSRV